MNSEIKAQWVAALRSGEYKQGTGALQGLSPEGESTFCCLGVLADLAVKAGVIKEVEPAAYASCVRYQDGVIIEASLTPRLVQEWAGMKDSNGEISKEVSFVNTMTGQDETSRYLSYINDASGMDFDQIADLIEQYM